MNRRTEGNREKSEEARKNEGERPEARAREREGGGGEKTDGERAG